MKKKIRLLAYLLTIMAFVAMLTNSCKKDDNNNTTNNGIIFNPSLTYGTMTDIEGNVYKTITIGTQTWMAENLKVTKYKNGDPIPNVTDSANWFSLTTGAYCDYNNTSVNSKTYGKLYNWFTVSDSRNIAPIGWHVPTDNEWQTLTSFLGGSSCAGKLKETGTTHWQSPNTGATNESGFTAIPGGTRGYGYVYGIGLQTFYWATTDSSDTLEASCRFSSLDEIDVVRAVTLKVVGCSVRCLKDN